MAKKESGKPSQGLGDTLEKIFSKTGIKYVVDTTFDALGEDCGCEKRKEKLNQLTAKNRWSKTPVCLTKDEYEFLTPIFEKTKISSTEQREINKIYTRVFSTVAKHTKCTTCLSGRINQLHAVYDTYEDEGE
jgi:hypothetical protein